MQQPAAAGDPNLARDLGVGSRLQHLRGQAVGSRSTPHMRPAGRARAPEAATPWVDTGDAVSAMYREEREQAREWALARNQMFEQATRAYLTGDKALAKELSAKGRWYNDQMKAAHARASEAIFQQRNEALPVAGGRAHVRTLDLHGLHVREARAVLDRELGAASSAHPVRLIVGTGHHPVGQHPARLPVAVQSWLDEHEIRYCTVQPGLLEAYP